LANTFHACDNYYKKLEDVADQNGTLPMIFTNAAMRKLYGDLIGDKVKEWEAIGGNINASLSSRAVMERYTRSIWQENHAKTLTDDWKELDGDFQEMIKFLTGCISVINEQRLSAVARKRRKEMEALLEKLLDIVKPLQNQYEAVRQHFTKDLRDYFSNLLSSVELAHEIQKQMRLAEWKDIANLAFGLILMWRHVRIVKVCVVISPSTPALPLPLSQWMMQSPLTMDPSELSPEASLCWPGEGGKRRIRCILAGLTYFWLQERCIEWKSETVAQELLTDVDMELSTHQIPANGAIVGTKSGIASNSSKRNKKKKGKSSSGSADEPSTPETSNHVDGKGITSMISMVSEVTKAAPVQEQGSTRKEASPGHREKEESKTANDTGSVSNENKFHLAESSETPSMQSKDLYEDAADGTGGDKYNDELSNLQNELDSYESIVVVQDENGVITAQDFLTNRLLNVMKEAESGSNVVILS
jgi:hypothetical protein